MKVLVACEYSGIVRDAFSAKGHDAYSNDILQTDRPGKHYQCDILEAFKKQVWDLIIMHLPCTKIALCGNSTYGVGMKKHSERLEAIEWTKYVWLKAISICDKVAFENPKNVMGKYIGKRTQVIQPFHFGHLERKETWLWLYGLPILRETNNVYNEMMLLPKKDRERMHYMSPSKNRGHDRSKTYKGIAAAMAEQWVDFETLNINTMKTQTKIEEFTDGQIDLLKSLVQGCNIALYRTGQIRLRDKEHNPLRNVRSDMFDKVREWCVQKEGLFYINPDMVDRLPMSIVKG